MLGTFKPGDMLVLEKIPLARIRKGDLIIFKSNAEENCDYVVHRVSRVTPIGLITRGDNCRQNDSELLGEENIIGRVIRYDRRGKIKAARNGRLGMVRSAALHGRSQWIRVMKYLLRPAYRILRKSRIVAKLWKPDIIAIYFETTDGPLIKYLNKERIVATCWLQTNRWSFKRPYELIIGAGSIKPETSSFIKQFREKSNTQP